MADVKAVIRERLAELDDERTRLQAALDALTGEEGQRPRRRSSSARSAATTRAKPGQRRSEVLNHLQKNPGARPSEIASSIGASAQQVSGVIRKLNTEKLVRKRGKGYGLSRSGHAAISTS